MTLLCGRGRGPGGWLDGWVAWWLGWFASPHRRQACLDRPGMSPRRCLCLMSRWRHTIDAICGWGRSAVDLTRVLAAAMCYKHAQARHPSIHRRSTPRSCEMRVTPPHTSIVHSLPTHLSPHLRSAVTADRSVSAQHTSVSGEGNASSNVTSTTPHITAQHSTAQHITHGRMNVRK